MSEWQPISTAPLDGEVVLLISEQGPDEGFFDDYNGEYPGEWSTIHGNGEPLFWMPKQK